jgi:hypothetical protein
MGRTVNAVVFLSVLAALAISERALERVALAQRKAPVFHVDPLWPKMPRQWILGQVSGLDVDARDHVWIIQRPWSLATDEKALNGDASCCRAEPAAERWAWPPAIQSGARRPRVERRARLCG